MASSEDQIVFIPLVSALHEPKLVEEVVGAYKDWLNGYFDRELPATSEIGLEHDLNAKNSAGILALVVTGGTEQLIQAVAKSGQPLIVLAHESMNSLPAALEALPSINGASRPQLILGKDMAELGKLRQFVKATKALARIRRHRMGLIGGPSPWLTYSLPDKKELSNRLGIRLFEVSMAEFKTEYEAANKASVDKLARRARSKTTSASELKLEDFKKSSTIYAAIKKIAERHNLTAVSVKCFDFISNYKATGCYAVATLNDERFVAGCEGDVPATTAMIVLSEVSGYPSFLANPSFIKNHKLVLAHCTIAPKLTTKYQYHTHFESGLGIAISGVLKKGERVTVARFSKTLDHLRAGEGTITKGDAWSEKLCRTQAEIKMDGDAEIIKDKPLGNHYVVTYGEHVHTLRNLASFAGIEFEEI